MSYQFDLKGSQLFLLVAGIVLVAGLLFVVGMIVGAGSTEPAETAMEASAAPETPAGGRSAEQEGNEQGVTPPAATGAAEPPRSGTPALLPPADGQTRKRIYELQLSAHLDENATQRVLEDLAASNLKPYVVESRDSRDRTLYTVRLGPWDSMAEAAEAARTFRQHTELEGYDPVFRHRPKPMEVGLSE